jgi:hypothetical protein
MKQLNTFSGKTFILSDTQAQQVEQNLVNGAKYLKLGDVLIASSSVEILSPIEKRPFFLGSPMTSDLRFVLKSGQPKVPFDQTHKDRIEWRDHIPAEATNISTKLIN